MHDPGRGETFRAARGSGAELNGTPIGVRDHDRLETALVATGFGYQAELRAAQARELARILPRVRDLRRGGSAALDLSWLACGRLDGYFERGLNPWDWGAGRLIVTEAGGTVRELEGEPAGLVAAGPALIDRSSSSWSGASYAALDGLTRPSWPARYPPSGFSRYSTSAPTCSSSSSSP